MATATYDYPNEDQGPAILGATFSVTALALITLAIRLFVRVKLIRNIGWDDYTMILAMVFVLAGQFVIIPEVKYGAGRHRNHIDPVDFQKGFMYNFVTQPIFLWAIATIKISIGFFLLRVAATPFWRRSIIGIMVFMGVYTLGCFLTIVLQCTNLAIQWDPAVKGTCWGPNTLKALAYLNLGLNITTDILFAVVIPIPMLWSVQMNRRTKGSVLGILGLGVFATVAALIKLTFLPNYGKTGDWLWDSRNITIWTVVESDMGIIAGNLPCMKPLFRKVLGSMYSRGSNGRSKYGTPRYGTGTNGKSAQNTYNALSSASKAQGDQYTGGDESHMMTRITARPLPGRGGSEASLGDDAESKMSDESVRRLNISPKESGYPLGGITKTTAVSTQVSFSHDGPSHEMTPERKEAHLV